MQLVSMLFLGGCSGPDMGPQLDALALALTERQAVVGAVRRSDDVLALVDSGLVLRVEPAEGLGEGVWHVHVQVSNAGPPYDVCITSMGATEGERLEQAAANFADLALPPILSRALGHPVAGAVRLRADDVWAVAGYQAFLGGQLFRGDLLPPHVALVPLFEGAGPLPADGGPHLLKAVLYCDLGVCKRTVELDGQPTAVAEVPAPVEDPPDGGMLTVFAVTDRPAGQSGDAARSAALAALEAAPAWLPDPATCPTELLPAELGASGSSLDLCRGGNLKLCVEECASGEADSCYAAALELEADEDAGLSESLYLRTCGLGLASGCTNAAAARGTRQGMDLCAVETLGRVCERALDPWACTMLAGELIAGRVVPRDPDRARAALQHSCGYGLEDPACAAARALLARLDTEAGPEQR